MISKTDADKSADVVSSTDDGERMTTDDIVNVDKAGKTCAYLSSIANMLPFANLPLIEAIAIRIKQHAVAVVVLIRKEHVGLHPITFTIDGQLKKRVKLPRNVTKYVAMMESALGKDKWKEMTPVLRGRVNNIFLSIDNLDSSVEGVSEMTEELENGRMSGVFCNNVHHKSATPCWPIHDVLKETAHEEVQRLLRLRKARKAEKAKEAKSAVETAENDSES